jgi:hypothetical protein
VFCQCDYPEWVFTTASIVTGERWCLKSLHLYEAHDLKWCMDGAVTMVAGNNYLSVKQTL